MDNNSPSPISRRALAIIAGVILAAVLISIGLWAATTIHNTLNPPPIGSSTQASIQPAQQSARAGDLITVTVMVQNVTNLAGAELHLAFDASVLEVIDAQPGQPGIQIAHGSLLVPDYVVLNAADNTRGYIDYALIQLNRPGVTGSGPLASIQFQGKGPGTSSIIFRSIESAPTGILFADANSQPVAVTVTTGEVTVSTVPAR